MIIAYVGSGGKTRAIHQAVLQYRSQDKKVLVMTSCHMMIEEDTLCTDDANVIIHELETKSYCMAGIPCSTTKMSSLSMDTYLKVCKYADVVLIEADGSRQLPIKVCRKNEPVIYENVDEINVVIGLSALGKKIKDVAFNKEGVCSLLNVNEEEIVDLKQLQKLLYEGYVKMLEEKYPDKKINILPSQANDLYTKACASLLKENQYIDLLQKEWFEAKPKLIILGAGHVGKEVAWMASRLDFQVRIFDDRKEFADPRIFLNEIEVIHDDFENVEKYFEDNAYYVVVTRGHQNDLECVNKILSSKYAYLGMIGSKKKIGYVKEQLIKRNHKQEVIDTLHSPIGLSIGATTPAEIAISILAEIIEFKNRENTSSISSELLNVDEPGVLCVLVNKTGSSPREKGSMMFVTKDKVIDTIGGGAMEFAAIHHARNIDHVSLQHYDLDTKESAQAGMVCGGSNEVLFIPIK